MVLAALVVVFLLFGRNDAFERKDIILVCLLVIDGIVDDFLLVCSREVGSCFVVIHWRMSRV